MCIIPGEWAVGFNLVVIRSMTAETILRTAAPQIVTVLPNLMNQTKRSRIFIFGAMISAPWMFSIM